jgi:cell division protein ZapA (FtsZ GTPase activity inhibitor)
MNSPDTKRSRSRARSLTRHLGEPLRAFERDNIFDENGIGQVQIEFLGKRIVIGCVEGEEDRAVLFAHRFEVDTGEVLKAVAGLDHTRAMLMAGLLAEGHIDDLEAQTRARVPGSDRIVGVDHNSRGYGCGPAVIAATAAR